MILSSSSIYLILLKIIIIVKDSRKVFLSFSMILPIVEAVKVKTIRLQKMKNMDRGMMMTMMVLLGTLLKEHCLLLLVLKFNMYFRNLKEAPLRIFSLYNISFTLRTLIFANISFCEFWPHSRILMLAKFL